MIQYNDNELLYLISENNEIALDILIDKYQPLIKNRLIKFKIKQNNFEDFYQECLMTFYKCIQRYREEKKIAFATYLDISIRYSIQNQLQKEKDYFYGVTLVSVEDIDYISKENMNFSNDNFEYDFKKLSAYESKVMGYLNEGHSIDYISKELNKKNRSIYNTISRIKAKVKQENSNMFVKKKDKLSNELSYLERKVYDKYLQGFKAHEISYLLRIDITSVYNALKRAKNKLK